MEVATFDAPFPFLRVVLPRLLDCRHPISSADVLRSLCCIKLWRSCVLTLVSGCTVCDRYAGLKFSLHMCVGAGHCCRSDHAE